MKSRSHKKALILAAVVLIAIAGGVIFWQVPKGADKPPESKPQQSNCKLIDNRQVCGSSYIGLTESAAMHKAEAEGLTARVVKRDGESFPITADLRPDRLNFVVSDGLVTGVDFY